MYVMNEIAVTECKNTKKITRKLTVSDLIAIFALNYNNLLHFKLWRITQN